MDGVTHMISSRRFVLGVVGILCLFVLGYEKGQDVSLAIASIVMGVAGANAYQGNKGDK